MIEAKGVKKKKKRNNNEIISTQDRGENIKIVNLTAKFITLKTC